MLKEKFGQRLANEYFMLKYIHSQWLANEYFMSKYMHSHYSQLEPTCLFSWHWWQCFFSIKVKISKWGPRELVYLSLLSTTLSRIWSFKISPKISFLISVNLFLIGNSPFPPWQLASFASELGAKNSAFKTSVKLMCVHVRKPVVFIQNLEPDSLFNVFRF